MISRWLLAILLAIVFAPGFLFAQATETKPVPEPVPEPSSPPPPSRPFVGQPPAPTDYNKMYEDIEILRRILDRKLTSLYPSVPSTGGRMDPFTSTALPGPTDGNTLLVTPSGQNPYLFEAPLITNTTQGHLLHGNRNAYPATIPFHSLEGVFLKGQGVVYTATVTSLQLLAKAAADSSFRDWSAAVVQRPTEWDSIRRQVRNEKETPKKPQENKPPELSDVVLRVLAENGHNFSQLGENESLTIILTVHDSQPFSAAHKTRAASSKAESSSAPASRDANLEREAGNLGMLGELHLKQAKYSEATQVFEKLLGLATGPKEEAYVHRKLAQCYLGLGQDEKARAELEKALALTKKGTEAQEKSTAAKPAAALPVKLIISTPKKLLDQMKEGKMSFEEFRRQASVETLRFGGHR